MMMTFYFAAAVAIVATLLVLTGLNAVHALLFLILSLLSVALVFYLLGAPLAAALEVIIYAGAIMVLFVFVLMMLNRGKDAEQQEREWWFPGVWVAPGFIGLVLLGNVLYTLGIPSATIPHEIHAITPKEVGAVLFHPYVIAVEAASLLLLPGLIGAFHLGRGVRKRPPS